MFLHVRRIPRDQREATVGAAVVALLCLATLAAAVTAQPVTGQLARSTGGSRVEFRSDELIVPKPRLMATSAEVRDPRTLIWDPVADFRLSPGEVNPNPDSYGSDGVWSYLASADFDHDPDRYSLLPHYSIIDSGRQQWDSPEFVNLLVAHLSGERRLLLHAFGGDGSHMRSAILGWRSPISGQVTVDAVVELSDTRCAAIEGGIVFWIDQGAHTLARFVIPAGGSRHVSLDTTVNADESLYFIVDPGLDSNCDTALLALSIRADAPVVPDTAMQGSSKHGLRWANEERR